MRGMTGSISKGDTAPKHNTRESYLEGHEPTDLEWIAEHLEELSEKEPNIDFMKTHKNVVIENRRIEDVYRECFGAAAEAYSAKQVEKGHPERQIHDYLEHVHKDKKLNEMYEFVVQCGNMDDHLTDEQSVAIYKQWLKDFKEKYGKQFAVKQAIIHLDEATPHMHVEVVPVAESKRGLSVQNSLNKAVKQAGHDNYKDMLAGWDEVLDTAMKDHGLERVAGDRDKQMAAWTCARTNAAWRCGSRPPKPKPDWSVFKAKSRSWNPLRKVPRRARERFGKVEEMEAGNAKLLDIANSLEAELRSWNSRCEQLESERDSLSERLSDLEWECETLEADLTELESV